MHIKIKAMVSAICWLDVRTKAFDFRRDTLSLDNFIVIKPACGLQVSCERRYKTGILDPGLEML